MWAQIVNVFMGVGLMISPAIFNFKKVAADNNHVAAPILLTFAIISLWEINRDARLFNIITGLWLVLSPFILGFASTGRTIDVIAGIGVIFFSLFKGKSKTNYGGGWISLFQKNPLHAEVAEAEKFKSNFN